MEVIKKQIQMNDEYLFYTLGGISKIQRQTIYTRYGINKKIIITFVPNGYNMEYMTLAKYVKEMRKQYELTQVDLSEKSGVGLRFIRELEQGKQTLRLDKVNQVLNLFGMEVGAVPMPKNTEL